MKKKVKILAICLLNLFIIEIVGIVTGAGGPEYGLGIVVTSVLCLINLMLEEVIK